MTPAAQPIAEWQEVDGEIFRTRIRAGGRPAVLRGLVAHWPAIAAGRDGPASLGRYLLSMYSGVPVPLYEAPSEAQGRFFYDERLTGFNFKARRAPLEEVIGELLALFARSQPPTLYSGSISLPIYLPGFTAANPLQGLERPGSALESIWIGNRTFVAPHFDASENIACVVGGRRRFTLFPPEEIANLYIGPIDRTPAGQPISLVDIRNPDFERFPRYRAALASAQSAELDPGDAIYVPTLWWHAVEGLEPLNVLVNYWWQESPAYFAPPMQSLLHCLLSIKSLPPAQRRAWKAVFDHLIFQTHGPALDHLPPEARGILGDLTAESAARIRTLLLEELTRRG